LIAQSASELEAALTFRGNKVLADPFRPSEDAVRLLRFQPARTLAR